MQSFSSNWIPNKDQSTTVINTDEIARKLEAAYGTESGSIRISTITINNGETKVDSRRRRRQLDRKKREIAPKKTTATATTAKAIPAKGNGGKPTTTTAKTPS
ncbi:unnamed protein product, partial [Rotaria sordida]